jgi:hypothetical protein
MRGPLGLGVIVIGDPGRVQEIARCLQAHSGVTVVARAESAEYAYGLVRRCLGEGVPVDAIFIDPLADRFDPGKSSLFVLETRTEHPGIAFVLLASESDLASRRADFLPEIRDRIGHYYRLDPALRESRLDVAVDEAVVKCLAWCTASRRPERRRYEYDVAISYAGEDRGFARDLAATLTLRGVRVFYDGDQRSRLWGRNLYTTLYDVYAHRCRFCIILVSRAYRDKMWTNHERAAAQARALEMREHDYILPVRMEDCVIPGLPPTVAYIPAQVGVEEIANLFVGKLASAS